MAHDRNHYHQSFAGIKIYGAESVTQFLCRFNISHLQSECMQVTCIQIKFWLTADLVLFALTGIFTPSPLVQCSVYDTQHAFRMSLAFTDIEKAVISLEE